MNGVSGNDSKTAQAAREAIEDQADTLLSEHGFSNDIDLNDILGKVIGQSVMDELSLSKPWCDTVFAVAKRNNAKKSECAAALANEINGVQFDERVASLLIELTSNDGDQRKSAVKRLFVIVWDCIVSKYGNEIVLPQMPNPELIVAILEMTQGEALRYCELFGVDDPNLAAFQILIANQLKDESMKLQGIVKMLDYFQGKLTLDSDIDEAFKAIIWLVDGKELMVQNWEPGTEDNPTHLDYYEALGKLLGMPKTGDNGENSFLMRYMTVTVQQRTSLLLHCAPEISMFLNKMVFDSKERKQKSMMPESADKLGPPSAFSKPDEPRASFMIEEDMVRALKAVCVGTDINVTAYATECGIDVSLANSVSYLLREDQKRGAKNAEDEASHKKKTSMVR